MIELQKRAIKKYKRKYIDKDINNEYFYSKISQDKSYIDKINKFLKKYNIKIYYKARTKDKTGKWIIDNVYIPVNYIEPK